MYVTHAYNAEPYIDLDRILLEHFKPLFTEILITCGKIKPKNIVESEFDNDIRSDRDIYKV